MKRLLIVFGVVATAAIMAPASASAHSYDNNMHDTQRCERLGYRLENLNGRFDQTNDRRVLRTQSVLDKLSDRECPAGNIVETLVENGNFTTLLAAVKSAGLADALSADGDKTVFAPTDQAFESLPEGTVEALLADTPTLTKILTYHVVDGAVDSNSAVELGRATTLNGQDITVEVRDDGVYINDSKLILTDIRTSNGIVHVIDTVLMPQS